MPQEKHRQMDYLQEIDNEKHILQIPDATNIWGTSEKQKPRIEISLKITIFTRKPE